MHSDHAVMDPGKGGAAHQDRQQQRCAEVRVRQDAARCRAGDQREAVRQHHVRHAGAAILIGGVIHHRGLRDRAGAGHQPRQQTTGKQPVQVQRLHADEHQHISRCQSRHADQQRPATTERVGQIAQQRRAEEHAERKERERQHEIDAAAAGWIQCLDRGLMEHDDDHRIHQAEREEIDEHSREQRQHGAQLWVHQEAGPLMVSVIMSITYHVFGRHGQRL